MDNKFDFCGWASKNNLKCSDGRTIMKDAFKHCDGKIVPLVWNHQHNTPDNVLGHAMLENKDEGVYAYCSFNNTERAQSTKLVLEHGDIVSLSICANELQERNKFVTHGSIREVSLVLAGANPGAFIENIMQHGAIVDDVVCIYSGEDIEINHADKTAKEQHENDDETIEDVFDTMTEKQKTAVYAVLASMVEDDEKKNKKEGDDEDMKHNIFDDQKGNKPRNTVLSHADQMAIIATAKEKGVNSLQSALKLFAEENSTELQHGFENISDFLPEFKDLKPGAPEILTDDQGWVEKVINKVHKSPISRIRTKQLDARSGLRARGYEKGSKKTKAVNVKLLKRTTDPQTIYYKEEMHRDDIVDITDFDIVAYQYSMMKMGLRGEIARAILLGDGREDDDADKISQEHLRSIFNEDNLYAIHHDLDLEAAKKELQGANTNAYFSTKYIYAEALVEAALFAREDYRGSGAIDYFTSPHSLNTMLLARDRNGRRIYESVSDLAKALNVHNIYTVEQFDDQVRIDGVGASAKTKKLVGIFVDLRDYSLGATRGGEITKFDQFDMDFNMQKYLLETRLSGALTKVKSAIIIEEDITATTAPDEVAKINEEAINEEAIV